jgi:hypothetical protein
MIAAYRFEAKYSGSISLETQRAKSLDINQDRSNPLVATSSDEDRNVLFEIGSSVQKSCAADEKNLNGINVKIVNEGFTDFCTNLSAIGGSENTAAISTTHACDPLSTISAAGQFAVSVMTQSIRDAFASFASFFGPDSNQASRVIFSGLVLASAALRASFPILKDALTNVPDPCVKLLITVISFSLATIHLLVSTVATIIATNNTPALTSGNNDAVDSKSNLEKIGDALSSLFSKVEDKFAELNEKGLVGWLGIVREWLLTSAAVVGFLSVLPLLVKTVGTIISAPIAAIAGGSITLAASILEYIHGRKEHDLLSIELKIMKDKASNEPNAVDKAAIDEKTRAILASKIRIGKSIVGIVTSVASIALGALTLAASIAIPYLPAIITTISLLSLVVILSVNFALRDMRQQEELAQKSTKEPVPDNAAPLSDDPSIDTKGPIAEPAELPKVQPAVDSSKQLSDIFTYLSLAMAQAVMPGNG